MIYAGEFALLWWLILSLEKRHCQRPNRGSGQYATKPVVPLQASVNTANNAAYPNTCSSDDPGHAFDEYERIDTALFFAARLGLDLRLLEHPIDSIRANRMQTLDARNWQQRRVRVVVLHNHLGAATSFNVCGSLSTHVLAVYSARAQRSRNHHATARRPPQTHAGQAGSGAYPVQYPAHWTPRAADFSDDRPLAHYSRFFCQTGDGRLCSTISASFGQTLPRRGRGLSHLSHHLRNMGNFRAGTDDFSDFAPCAVVGHNT